MHISLKFENLNPRLKINWMVLRRVIAMAKTIYPHHNVQIHLKFSYATAFYVDADLETMIVHDPIKVTLMPMMDIRRIDINSQYDSIAKKLVDLILHFLAVSDPANDPSVQPVYTPPSEISISAGLGADKFINGEPDPYL